MTALVACRVLHIAAACSSFGGLLYARAVFWPSLRVVPVEVRGPLLDSALRRFGVIKWTGVAVVAVTGAVQWWAAYPGVADVRAYVASFVLKMAGAVALLLTTASLAIPGEALAPMRRRRGLWSAMNLMFAGVILTGATLMHFAGLHSGGRPDTTRPVESSIEKGNMSAKM